MGQNFDSVKQCNSQRQLAGWLVSNTKEKHHVMHMQIGIDTMKFVPQDTKLLRGGPEEEPKSIYL